MTLTTPEQLAASCARAPERAAWLERLPGALRDLERRWSLTLGEPLDGDEGSASRVAPVTRADGTIRRFADLLGVEHERVHLWLFARTAAESGGPWDDETARVLTPRQTRRRPVPR